MEFNNKLEENRCEYLDPISICFKKNISFKIIQLIHTNLLFSEKTLPDVSFNCLPVHLYTGMWI